MKYGIKLREIFEVISCKGSKTFIFFCVFVILLMFPIVARVMGSEDRGIPNKIQVPCTCSWSKDISFGVIADTHVDADSFWGMGDFTIENRGEVHDLNIDCKNSNCLFVAHVGDIIYGVDKNDQEDNGIDELIAFRQLWENDYPGQDGGSISNHDHYSDGNRIKFPVFPTTGNHDICACGDYWYEVVNYIADRIRGASGIIDSYKSDTYAWRVGQYYFIHLGLWAGSLQCGNFSATDRDKVIWLQNFLNNHVGDSGFGVLIFQHFGWDGFSTNGQWWNASQRLMELNVLCRRDIDNTDENAVCNPYNVLGIFSGHIHSPQDLNIQVKAGKDSHGQDVYFRNLSMRTSGDTHSATGFSIVHLDGQQITIRSKNRSTGQWSTDVQPIYTPQIAGWSDVKRTGQFVGASSQGGGAAIADINGNGRPELVFMAVDNPPGQNNFRYVVGFDLDGNGNPSSWSGVKYGPGGFGDEDAGGGVAIADINGNGRPDLVFMAVDNPPGANEFRYVVGYDLNASGDPTGWSSVKIGPKVGNETAGGGAAVADIDGNGTLDLLLVAVDRPSQANQFWYLVGWDLQQDGTVGHWSEQKRGPCIGWSTAGGGAAIGKIDRGGLDLLLMAIDKPVDINNEFLYTIGWNLDKNGDPTNKSVTSPPPSKPKKPKKRKSWRDQLIEQLRGH